MKTCGRVGIQIHVCVTSAVVGGASLPDRFDPQGKPSGIHWIGGWVGLRTGLDDVEE
jgi:hypothetical protein